MYKSFYNLDERPFQLSADPRFLWLGAKHSEALAVLKYGLIGEKGFLLLTGDVGAGKTTLVNALLKSLDDSVLVANVTDPSLDLIGFLNHIALSFNIPQRFNRKEDFLIYFKDFLLKTCQKKGKHVLLIIDEAHKLSTELLEQIRLLSNIELPEKKLINIFFVGQNELNQKLMTNEFRALRQRVTLNYNIKPLSETETQQYIKHRLKVAGTESQIFDRKAIHEIYCFSGGCPRLINMVCDRALLTGYVRGQKKITVNAVKECSQEVLLPGERKENLHFDLSQAERKNSSSPADERPSAIGDTAEVRESGNDDLSLKESETTHEATGTKTKSEEIVTRESALRSRIEGFISLVLRMASFLKTKTEGLILRGLAGASLYLPKGKGLIFWGVAAAMLVFTLVLFPLTYSYFFKRSDRQKPATKILATKEPVESDKVLAASAGIQAAIASDDAGINSPADDEAASVNRALLEQAKKAQADGNFILSLELLEEAMARHEGNHQEIKALYVSTIRDQAALLLKNDTDKAKTLLQKAVKVDPQDAMTYYDLGKVYSQTKDHLKAIEAYKKAADLNSHSADIFFNLGFTYAAIKDYLQAEQMFLRVVELEPPYLDKAIVNLALVQYKQGKKQQCIENLGKALKVNPDNQKAQKYLEMFTSVSGG